MTSRNKREGAYGGYYKGHHYRSEYSLKYNAAQEEWFKSPDGVDWLAEVAKWEKSNEDYFKDKT